MTVQAKGIECPTCGTTVHDVKYTLKAQFSITRKRLCFNDHIFNTIEIIGGVDLYKDAEKQRHKRKKA